MSRENRYHLIDLLRAIAIILMVIFHFTYDLNYFGHLSINFLEDPFWVYFPRVIVALFLFCTGLSLFSRGEQKLDLKAFLKRFLLILLAAITISLVTFKLFPQNFIYFGTLHCISLSLLVGIFFRRKPHIALLVALLLIFLELILPGGLPWPKLNQPALDYIPFLPWFSIVLLGIGTAPYLLRKKLPLPIPNNCVIKKSVWLSKNSLAIYLLHQPIMFGVIYLIEMI